MLKAYEKTKESADVKGNIEAKSLATVERERERESNILSNRATQNVLE